MNRETQKRKWSLLVKPSCDCNYSCEYCYDEPFRKKYKGIVMTEEILDRTAKLAGDYASTVQWIWHGGEPTLLGVEWYINAQEHFYKYYRTQFVQSMQSNGSLLDTSWARLAYNHGIEIGVSFDVFTQNVREKSNSSTVDYEQKAEVFKNCGLGLGIITVINERNVDKIIELYEYFKKSPFNQPSFNRIFRTDGSIGNNLEFQIEKYMENFQNYYLHWLHDSSPKALGERSILEATKQIIGSRDICCTNNDCRLSWIGVYPNGDIYPCDRYVSDKYYIGNIMEFNSIEEVYTTEGFKKYYTDVQKRFDTYCRSCGYHAYCMGGCNANHIAVTGGAEEVDSVGCEIFRRKYNFVYAALRNLDIYCEKLNKHFIRLLLEDFITWKEIREFITLKGYDKTIHYNLNGYHLFESIEFKLFRVFNPYKGEIDGHSDFKEYKAKISVVVDEYFKMEVVKRKRFELMDEIYNTNLQEINVLLRMNESWWQNERG